MKFGKAMVEFTCGRKRVNVKNRSRVGEGWNFRIWQPQFPVGHLPSPIIIAPRYVPCTFRNDAIPANRRRVTPRFNVVIIELKNPVISFPRASHIAIKINEGQQHVLQSRRMEYSVSRWPRFFSYDRGYRARIYIVTVERSNSATSCPLQQTPHKFDIKTE